MMVVVRHSIELKVVNGEDGEVLVVYPLVKYHLWVVVDDGSEKDSVMELVKPVSI